MPNKNTKNEQTSEIVALSVIVSVLAISVFAQFVVVAVIFRNAGFQNLMRGMNYLSNGFSEFPGLALAWALCVCPIVACQVIVLWAWMQFKFGDNSASNNASYKLFVLEAVVFVLCFLAQFGLFLIVFDDLQASVSQHVMGVIMFVLSVVFLQGYLIYVDDFCCGNQFVRRQVFDGCIAIAIAVCACVFAANSAPLANGQNNPHSVRAEYVLLGLLVFISALAAQRSVRIVLSLV
jgi:hypothetical protein